jgi:uncharacterized membrane-anchored protein YjiN (DUF445 family)
MRLVALAVLVVMLAVYVASSILQLRIPGLAWLRTFAEAGAAGAVADWYAVVALFRHPLGLPMPHTAIIPKNKDRIAGRAEYRHHVDRQRRLGARKTRIFLA